MTHRRIRIFFLSAFTPDGAIHRGAVNSRENGHVEYVMGENVRVFRRIVIAKRRNRPEAVMLPDCQCNRFMAEI